MRRVPNSGVKRSNHRWRQVTGHVRGQVPCGAEHYWLDVDLPASFTAPTPGQFVQLLLGAEAAGTFLPRPMSVAGVKRNGRALTLGFLYAAVGVGTRALASLEPGARVEVLGPLGRGFPLERPGIPVLIAGGRGVAPLLFAARDLTGRRPEFLFGARDREHLVRLDEAGRATRRARGRLHLCTDDGSHGLRGNVLDLLERIRPELDGAPVIHACGPHVMLAAVARWALRRRVEAWLAMESVMACGTGVCRGCPMPRSVSARRAFDEDAPSLYGNRSWAMCCTDGPVFESRSLDWERVH